MKALFGPVVKVNFHDEETGYAILRVKTAGPGGEKFVSVKGTLLNAENSKGQFLKYVGKENEDGDFQAAAIYDPLLERPNAPLEPFFEGKQFPRLTKKLAGLMQEKLGRDWESRLMKNSKEAISSLGLDEATAKGVQATWNVVAGRLRPYFILSNMGMSFRQAMSTIDALGSHAEIQIFKSPYTLKMVNGVGLNKADEIAQDLGIKAESKERLRHLVTDAVERATSSGHTIVKLDSLSRTISRKFSIAPEDLRAFIKNDEKLKVNVYGLPGVGSFIASPSGIQTTKRIAERLKDIHKHGPRITGDLPEPNSDFPLEPEQKEAIEVCTRSPLSVLTGGPGTGKTTIVKEVVNAIRSDNPDERIMYGSLAGKAARRLAESVGEDAGTVHSILGMRPGKPPKYNESNKLPCDTFVLDEASMVDEAMMLDLLKALPDGCRLIVVGDSNQLPSIGAGSVLRDMIRSEVIPCVQLKKSKRFDPNSGISLVSKSILDGKDPDLSPRKDFTWVESKNPRNVGDQLIGNVKEALARGIPPGDIQCLTPQYGTDIGAKALNRRLKPLLNPGYKSKPYVSRFGQQFHVDDRVMQTGSNDYELNLFNGDIGIISDVDFKGHRNEDVPCITLTVDDERGQIKVPFDKLNRIQHAWAKSIHKSQGSEYPFVIMPVSGLHRNMIDRTLLFTGTTRTRSELCMVGDESVLGYGVRNTRSHDRETLLAEAMRKSFANELDQKRKGPAQRPAPQSVGYGT